MMKIIALPFALFFSFSALAQKTAHYDSLKVNTLGEISIIGNNLNRLVGSGAAINAKKIQKLNQTDINKVLLTLPGVNIRDEEGFGLRPNIGLRGTPVNRSAKITLMEDGVLMAPAPYADPSAYYFPTFARMERVEVLKGSSQIKYGPYTIGGALNLISTSIPESFGGFAQLSYGSFGTNQQRIWVGDSRKNFDYVFEVNRLASNGFKELDFGGNTGFDRRDLMGKLRWHTAADAQVQQSLTLKFVNMTEDGNESYLGLTYDDFKTNANRRYAATQRDVLDMNHQHISLKHVINLFKNFNITTTGYYAKTFRDWARVNSVGGVSLNNVLADPSKYDTAYQIMTGQEDGNINYQSAARTFNVKGIQSNIGYQFTGGAVSHHIQAGIRYHEDEADRYATQSTFAMTDGTMVLSTAGIKGNNENQLRKAKSLAAYFQYELKIYDLTITPGIRYEDIQLEMQNYGNTDYARLGTALKTAKNELSIFLPGVGAHYAINKNMSLFGGVHKGFSPPGMPSTSTTTQAGTETAINYELGYRYHSRHLRAQAVGFMNDYENILGSDNVSGGGAGTGDMFNAGNAIIQGLELSIDYNIMSAMNKKSSIRLPLGIAYTYTDARFQQTFVNAGGDWGTGTINKGDLIPFITPHLLTATIGIENEQFNITMVGRLVGDTRTKPGQGTATVPADGVKYNDVNTIGKYVVIDLSANYNFYKNFTVFTAVNNLLNKQYIVANLPQGYRPGMPLGIQLGVKANF
jgi:Fe(3+) dicitrate transport protein